MIVLIIPSMVRSAVNCVNWILGIEKNARAKLACFYLSVKDNPISLKRKLVSTLNEIQ